MEGLFSAIPLIIFFPFAGVVINAFFGRLLMPNRDSVAPGVVASLMSGASFVIALLMFIGLLGHPEKGRQLAWFPYREALEQLTFPDTRALLKEAWPTIR